MPIWALVLTAVSLAAQVSLAALQMASAKKLKPGTLHDFDYPQFEEGSSQAVIFGDCWSAGWFVLWYGNLRTKPIRSNGGKK